MMDAEPSVNTSEKSTVDRALARAELDAKKVGRITREDIDAIVQEIKQLKYASPTQSLLLVRCCGNLVPEEAPRARTSLVKDIWKTLENLGVPLDISHYNALLRVYLENEHNFNPIKFLETLESRNIAPNRVTYQRLMAAYCQKGDIEGASSILEIMKEKDLPIGELVFNSLITGHANSGDMESAKGVLNVMSQAGLEPDNETYRALLCGYAKNGMSNEISATLGECEKNDISLYDRDLLEVLYTAAVNGHSAIVDDLLNRMRKHSGYNQDCVNVVLRLINSKKEDEAFKVLLSMTISTLFDGKSPTVGGFFIRQIVRSKCSNEKIISFCERLVDSGMNHRAYFRALEVANAMNRTELSNLLLQKIQKQKESLQPTSFWPLLNSQSKVHGEKGVLDALRQMAAIQVTPNIDTINQHVLPHIEANNVQDALRKLRSADVPPSVVALSLMIQTLNRGDFKSATEVASKIYLKFDNPLVRKAATEAYLKTRDAPALATFICSMLRQPQQGETEQVDYRDRAADIAGPIVKEIYSIAPKPKLEVLEPVLKALRDAGIGVSQSVAQFIQESAADFMTEPVAELLVELGSGKLTPSNVLPHPADNVSATRRAYKFVEYAREHKIDEALREKEALDANKFVFTDALNILLMDLYAYHGRYDEAIAVNKALLSSKPDLVITPVKLISLATNFLKGDRTEDALQFIQRLKPSNDKSTQGSNAIEMASWRLLNTAASKGDAQLTQKIFDELEKSEAVKVTNLVVGPLVKVHLNKDDLESALNSFTQLSEKYNATPLKSILLAKLIEAEDAQRLQKVMDVSIKVHGEMNSLYDLVFAFLEGGRVRQAKKVLETPGLRARSDRLEMACRRYVEEKRVAELENLVKITKDVYGLDRASMYEHLLKAYISTDDATRASNLWTQMQEEDCQPSEEFLRKLGKFLSSKNLPVPFSIPDAPETPSPAKSRSKVTASSAPKAAKSVVSQIQEQPASIPKTKFNAAITEGNADAALEAKQLLDQNGENLSVRESSNLIEILVRSSRLSEASEIVQGLLQSNRAPIPRVFRYYLASLSSVGDHQTLRSLGQYLDQEKRRLVSYENVIASAIAHDSASVTTYLDGLLQEIQQVGSITNKEERDVQVKEVNSKFPRGGLLGILEKNPDAVEKCKEIASEFLKLNAFAPINALWCYYVIHNMKEEARSAWEKLQASEGAIGFQSVCRHVRDHQNTSIGELLVETLSSSPKVKTSALGVAYSALIDALRTKAQIDEAMTTLEGAIKKGVLISEINRSCLVALKSECERLGKSFPHQIPQAVRDNSRSDTSSEGT